MFLSVGEGGVAGMDPSFRWGDGGGGTGVVGVRNEWCIAAGFLSGKYAVDEPVMGCAQLLKHPQ